MNAITADRIAFLALSIGPLLRMGHWPIVGNAPVDDERIPWPTYKVAIALGSYIVEDHLGRRLRHASDQNVAALRFPTAIAPIRFENAMKALHGQGEWLSEYDPLVVS